MRRRFQIFTLTCSVLILLSVVSRWSSPTFTESTPPVREVTTPIKPKTKPIRADLPKYIHLDLKGAPPKADAFYPNFFQFIDKLQMGVKGVLIEYEDTLPLEGRLANVSEEEARGNPSAALL